MSRCGPHTFISNAPTFGADEDMIDPFFDPPADRAALPPSRAAKAPSLVPFGERAPVILERSK